MKSSFFPLFLLLSLLLSSCSVYEKLPSASFRGPTLKGVQTDVAAQELEIELGLRFLFDNPFKRDLMVPEHQFTVRLNGDPVPGQLARQAGFTIPAEGSRMVTYTYVFDLSPGTVLSALNVLGRDNYYEFETEIELDLSDYGIKIPTSLGKIPLRKHKIPFSFGDTIRLPLLPVVEPAGQPGSVRFLGQLETFDLTPVKDAMTPAVDLLLDAEFSSELTDPFIELLLNTEVAVPNPTLNNPFRTQKVNAIDHLINTLLSPIDGEAGEKWEALKDKLQPGTVNLMDHLVNTFFEPLNGQANENWSAFKTQWANFKNRDLDIRYPGPRVTGLQVEVPFRIYNPNEFSIQAPSVFAAAAEGSNEVLQFRAAPVSAGGRIPPRSRREMTLLLTIDWGQAGQGLLDFLQGQTLQPRLRGRTSIDIGYDLMEVEMDIPVQLQAGMRSN